MIQVHQLKSNFKRKLRKRVGRGGKRGTYSGHGIKGQKARAGAKFMPIIRGIIKRYPKRRGYRFTPVKAKPFVLNLHWLEKKFEKGQTVSPQSLFEKKIIRRINGKIPTVKILGMGEIKKNLTIQNCLLSKTAKEKIEKAGGQIK